jgi:hypothetical protein
MQESDTEAHSKQYYEFKYDHDVDYIPLPWPKDLVESEEYLAWKNKMEDFALSAAKQAATRNQQEDRLHTKIRIATDPKEGPAWAHQRLTPHKPKSLEPPPDLEGLAFFGDHPPEWLKMYGKPRREDVDSQRQQLLRQMGFYRTRLFHIDDDVVVRPEDDETLSTKLIAETKRRSENRRLGIEEVVESKEDWKEKRRKSEEKFKPVF